MEATSHYALAIDLGTGGPKIGLVSLAGETAWWEHLRVETVRGADGAAEQDAAHWWELIRGAARRALGDGVVSPERVAAVAVTGQWASRVPVDGEGEPVGPCVLWMDTRGRRHSRAMIGGPVAGYRPLRALHWLRRTGGVPSPDGSDPLSHILYLERERPETVSVARWLLEPVDYLTMRFTGRATATPASMLAAWLTDNRDPDGEPVYDPSLVAAAGVDRSRLPPLLRTGSVVGTVREDVASELGLVPGVRVVTGVPDLHAATVGSGATELGAAHLSVSTSGWISCPVAAKKTDVRHSMASVPGLGDGRYLIGNSIDSAGVCVEWARTELFGGAIDYAELIALAGEADAGSAGVVFAPWLAGTRSPVDDRSARGGWLGVSLRTRRAELIRAVLEGVACHGRWLLEAVDGFVGRRLEPIRIIGGGARSDLWCQIHADVTGRTFERVHDPANAVMRGAAVFAGRALGAVGAEQVHGLAAVDATFSPQAGTRQVYDRLYREHVRLHRAQRGMSARLLG
jgi:xylulokinase